jgi:RNA polymerase sigma factor (sigma-70 family)
MSHYSYPAKTCATGILFFGFVFGYASFEQACNRMTQSRARRHSETTSVPGDYASRTSVTLLGRLRQDPKDQAAWDDFVARYQPQILKWCRGWRLQESDARDVTQDVLLKLHHLLAKFAYDPSRSFRGWLKTLTHHAWRDVVADRKHAAIGSGDSQMRELFENIQAGDDLDKHLEEELQRELMDQAMALVRLRVEPRTWDAFRLTALEGSSGATASDRLEMNIARVYAAKSEVKKMIREEIRKLVRIE